jgi:tetratricopeptide (TPR) repeat protein
MCITYFVLKQYLTQQYDKNAIKNGIIISVCIINMIPIVISIFELTGWIPVFNNEFKMCGGLNNQGAYANYVASLAPFSFTILLLGKKNSGFIKFFSLVTFLLSIIIIVITKSRSAWIACAVSMIYITTLNDKISGFIKRFSGSKPRKLIIISFALVVFLSSVYALYHFKKESADGRIFVWNNCLAIIKEKPLFGHGFNSFIKTLNEQQIGYFQLHSNDMGNGMLASSATFAFNDYLQITIELGIVGLILFLLLCFFIFYKKKSQQRTGDYIMLTGSKACVISILVCALFSYPLQVAQNCVLLFIFLAIISANTLPLFKINVINRNILIFLIIISICFIEFYEIKKYIACTKWEKAYLYAGNKNTSKACETYEDIYPVLKTDPLFLFNYGSTLSNFNEYEKSIFMLEASGKIKTSYDLYLNLGCAYEGANHDSLSEQNYEKARFLIPHKFVPRYRLFKIYQKTNQVKKAMTMAKEIMDIQIKVYSPTVGQIKKAAFQYLNHGNNF